MTKASASASTMDQNSSPADTGHALQHTHVLKQEDQGATCPLEWIPQPTKATAQPAASSSKSPQQPAPQAHLHFQYPPLQFVHVPYGYPVVVPPGSRPGPHQPQAPAQRRPNTHAHPSQPPHPEAGPQLPALDVLFQETVQRFRDLETLAKHTILRHQQEKQKWRSHCVTFKQERDVARRQVLALMQERAHLLSQQRRNSEPTPGGVATGREPISRESASGGGSAEAGSVAATDLSACDQRKAARDLRKHAPYGAPAKSRRSLSPASSPGTSPTHSAADVPPQSGSTVVYSSVPPAKNRASSSPPSLPQETRRPPSEALPLAAAAKPAPIPAFVSYDPVRTPGDPTAFEVNSLSSPKQMPLDRTPSPDAFRATAAAAAVPRATVVVRSPPPPLRPAESVNGEADMDLESDDEMDVISRDVERQEAVLSSPSDCPLPSRTTAAVAKVPGSKTSSPSPIDLHHLELMYIPAHNKLWCRMCLFHRSQTIIEGPTNTPSSAAPGICTFEVTASWEELHNHAVTAHPSECQHIAQLSSYQISDLQHSA